MTAPSSAPVITLDGPGGAGKGTLALALAERLGWHVLDSGALYRAMGLMAERAGWSPERSDHRAAAAQAATELNVGFVTASDGVRVYLAGEDITQAIRTAQVAESASRWASVTEMRDALLACQRAFATRPGLVADGRDMGTVVFPSAQAKFFITASAKARARRRLAQLSMPETTGNIGRLYNEIKARDTRDRERNTAPLVPAVDAFVLDTTDENPAKSLDRLMVEVARRGLG